MFWLELIGEGAFFVFWSSIRWHLRVVPPFWIYKKFTNWTVIPTCMEPLEPRDFSRLGLVEDLNLLLPS